MPNRKIFHVYRKDKDRHAYYGGIAAIFKHESDVGCSIHKLYREKFLTPFENDKVIIRCGQLKTVHSVPTTEKEALPSHA